MASTFELGTITLNATVKIALQNLVKKLLVHFEIPIN